MVALEAVVGKVGEAARVATELMGALLRMFNLMLPLVVAMAAKVATEEVVVKVVMADEEVMEVMSDYSGLSHYWRGHLPIQFDLS